MEDAYKNETCTKLFIKQLYTSISSIKMTEKDSYLILNSKRLSNIYIQGVITKIFRYRSDNDATVTVRALLDDGSGVIIISDVGQYVKDIKDDNDNSSNVNNNNNQITKGAYIMAYGALSLSENGIIALLIPETIKVLNNPNIETLWNLECTKRLC